MKQLDIILSTFSWKRAKEFPLYSTMNELIIHYRDLLAPHFVNEQGSFEAAMDII